MSTSEGIILPRTRPGNTLKRMGALLIHNKILKLRQPMTKWYADKTLYEILRISPDASDEEIRLAFWKLAKTPKRD